MASPPRTHNSNLKLPSLNVTSGKEASEELLNLVYDELRRQAYRYLTREHAGHTLQTTALVHEVYMKLAKQKNVA